MRGFGAGKVLASRDSCRPSGAGKYSNRKSFVRKPKNGSGQSDAAHDPGTGRAKAVCQRRAWLVAEGLARE